MQFPDSPPSLTFKLLDAGETSFRFAFAAKRAAMEPHVTKRWTWDESAQQQLHRARMSEKPFWKILWSGTAAGTISLMRRDEFIRFGEFYLFPEHQRKGIGTQVLRHCSQVGNRLRLPMRLEYLKWNPVGALYRRNGLIVIGETETHWLMEREPQPEQENS